MSTRETVVFAFDTAEQRKQMMDMLEPMMSPDIDRGLRVVALSVGNEVSRVSKMYEATERYRDRNEIIEAIDSLFQTEEPEKWTFEAHDSDDD